MENVAYNCTLSYGTCYSFISVYSFCINVYERLYFLILPIKDLINKDSEPTTPFKLATGTNPSVSHLRVLFCSCVVRKATALVGILQHQKGYLVHITHTKKIIVSYDVF